jgi:hypothetical protein
MDNSEYNMDDISGQASFDKAVAETVGAIEVCIAQGLFVPAQILIFSCMDAFSSIELEQIINARDRFEAWVNKRILPHEDVLYSSVDLYAAGSGVLHRLGTRPRLLESGQARSIAFSFGAADFMRLRELRAEMLVHSGRSLPIVKLEALFEALRKAIDSFLTDVDATPELKAKMDKYWKAEQPFRFPS